MTTVFYPKEISALFTNANNNFPVLIGKPSDYDVQHIHPHNFSSLQDINLGHGTNATGLILSEVDHKAPNANQVFG